MCSSEEICTFGLWTVVSVVQHYKNPTQRVGLVQSKHHYHFIKL